MATAERCGDQKDNDCDGEVDESDAQDAVRWYVDCDHDGFTAGVDGSVFSCEKPEDFGSCSWTAKASQASVGIDWDCDDKRAAYSPLATYGRPPFGATRMDLNCDLLETIDPKYTPAYKNCDASAVTWANAGADPLQPGSCNSSYVTDMCLIWRQPSGVYKMGPATPATPNTVTCVDQATLVRYDGSGCFIDLNAKQPSWPCR